MWLGGLWHGASWTFVIWGALHGLYLLVNHAWRASGLGTRLGAPFPRWLRVATAVALTFVATVFAWVFFRAADLPAAWLMVKGMLGLHGLGLEQLDAMRGQINRTLVCLFIIWACPNSQQILARFRPALEMPEPGTVALRWWMWRPNPLWLVVVAVAAAAALLSLNQISEFIYFNF
jgi:hypothetical protein